KGWGPRRLIEHIERHWLVALWLNDPHWRVLDTFDAITPEIATTHTQEEVVDWLTAAGCESVRRTPWCPTSATSLKTPVQVVDLAVGATLVSPSFDSEMPKRARQVSPLQIHVDPPAGRVAA